MKDWKGYIKIDGDGESIIRCVEFKIPEKLYAKIQTAISKGIPLNECPFYGELMDRTEKAFDLGEYLGIEKPVRADYDDKDDYEYDLEEYEEEIENMWEDYCLDSVTPDDPGDFERFKKKLIGKLAPAYKGKAEEEFQIGPYDDTSYFATVCFDEDGRITDIVKVYGESLQGEGISSSSYGDCYPDYDFIESELKELLGIVDLYDTVFRVLCGEDAELLRPFMRSMSWYRAGDYTQFEGADDIINHLNYVSNANKDNPNYRKKGVISEVYELKDVYDVGTPVIVLSYDDPEKFDAYLQINETEDGGIRSLIVETDAPVGLKLDGRKDIVTLHGYKKPSKETILLKEICKDILDVEEKLFYGGVNYTYDKLMAAMKMGSPGEILDMILQPVYFDIQADEEIDLERLKELNGSIPKIV